ncbi:MULTISPECIES: hypothetical protein [unclassified Streptomyces]|uniref:hypothetical protein n=1 Tax=unclassified Streptomyces TaxID=2593676 RepID=UPI0033AF5D56
MPKRSAVALGPAAVVFTLYHALTLLSDLQACTQNLRAYRARPTVSNLARLLLAEGVFIKDLGLGA